MTALATGRPVAAVPGQLSFDELMGSPAPKPDTGPEVGLELELEAPPAVGPDGSGPELEPEQEHQQGHEQEPLEVEVIRSPRRRKTAQARLVGSTVEIRIPGRCSKAEERELVAHFRSKFERDRRAGAVDLERRAERLAAEHDLPTPISIRWVANQRQRWGSCTPSEGTIRLSDRMAGFPSWVIDYVIVHELAHLAESNHSPAFWALVNRYPRTERARGYLLAMSEQDQGD